MAATPGSAKPVTSEGQDLLSPSNAMPDEQTAPAGLEIEDMQHILHPHEHRSRAMTLRSLADQHENLAQMIEGRTANDASGARQYPDESDLAAAHKSGFGYGTGSEPFIDQQRAKLYGRSQKEVVSDTRRAIPALERADRVQNWRQGKSPETGVDVEGSPEIKDALGDVYARAALLANRSPIGALGLDPHRTTVALEPKIGPNTKESDAHDYSNVLGVYHDPSEKAHKGEMFVSTRLPPEVKGQEPAHVMVHEALHRGVDLLREAAKKDRKLAHAMDELGIKEMYPRDLNSGFTEEEFVEHLVGRAGNRGSENVYGGASMRSSPIDPRRLQNLQDQAKGGSKDARAALDRLSKFEEHLGVLERAAQDLKAKRRERGPR